MTRVSFLRILALASATCSAQSLVLELYDYTDRSASETDRLTETPGEVFVHSGVHVVWRYCLGKVAAASGTVCGHKLEANEIVVRLLPGAPRTSYDGRMGQTMVTADGGSYASVFVESVRAQAAEFGIAFDILLGYAVAHEVGHCLLGPGHSYAGLMRGAWNRKDASEMTRVGLHLTKQESRKAATRVILAGPAASK